MLIPLRRRRDHLNRDKKSLRQTSAAEVPRVLVDAITDNWAEIRRSRPQQQSARTTGTSARAQQQLARTTGYSATTDGPNDSSTSASNSHANSLVADANLGNLGANLDVDSGEGWAGDQVESAIAEEGHGSDQGNYDAGADPTFNDVDSIDASHLALQLGDVDLSHSDVLNLAAGEELRLAMADPSRPSTELSDLPSDRIGMQIAQELLSSDHPLKAVCVNRVEPWSPPRDLACSEVDLRSLRVYAAWALTNGTVAAYDHFADTHRVEGRKVHSLEVACRLATEQSSITTHTYDMCRNSCMAFTGQYADLTHCRGDPASPGDCGLARFNEHGKPYKTFEYVPVLPLFQSLYANPKWSDEMRYRHHRQRENSKSKRQTGQPESYGDIHDGSRWDGIPLEPRDIVVAITTDGAQLLANRKSSSAWLILLQNLNLRPELRFNLHQHHLSVLVPGPNNPKDCESFLWPLCAELCLLSEHGAWTWDGKAREWFRLRVHLAGLYADQPGSAKFSKHVGGNGSKGCRFCNIRAVFAADRGSSAYFPLQARRLYLNRNQGRPNYDPTNLPHRTQDEYAAAIRALAGKTGRPRAAEVTKTGVGGLPLVSFSRLFGTFYFFPIDPFHLLHLNVPSLLWSTWTSSLGQDEFGLDDTLSAELGLFVHTNGKRYPSIFSSRAPRDIDKFVNTKYKMVEWAAVFHHFVPAFLFDIQAPLEVQRMVAIFLLAADTAMSDQDLTPSEVDALEACFVDFVQTWERLYVKNDISLNRATISVHQLLHIADQIRALGSVKATSQASCERYLGSIKARLSQFKEPYKTLTNRVLSRSRISNVQIRKGLLLPSPEGAIIAGTSPSKKRIDGRLSVEVDLSKHLALTVEESEASKWLLDELGPQLSSPSFYCKMFLRCGRDASYLQSTRAAVGRSASSIYYTDRNGRDAFGEVIHFVVARCVSKVWNLAFVRIFQPDSGGPTEDDPRRRLFTVGKWTHRYTHIETSSIKEVAGNLLTLRGTYVMVRRKPWQTADVDYGRGQDEVSATAD
ncbi:hypothetical protein A4X13_0g1058 [Tilletia indica]|uniref:Uncharacterized protein n=1 Tax=Tilletia indica TaxID=43049 RepID=A0A177TEY2_9BASI|nr:hypothetical protein A4X13_0g1058 [Tilletia indica]